MDCFGNRRMGLLSNHFKVNCSPKSMFFMLNNSEHTRITNSAGQQVNLLGKLILEPRRRRNRGWRPQRSLSANNGPHFFYQHNGPHNSVIRHKNWAREMQACFIFDKHQQAQAKGKHNHCKSVHKLSEPRKYKPNTKIVNMVQYIHQTLYKPNIWPINGTHWPFSVQKLKRPHQTIGPINGPNM